MTSTTEGRFVTSLRGGFSAPEELERELAKERAAPDSDRQQACEDHDRVDARPARTCPVHILEIERERELVEGQRSRDAVCDGGDAREKAGGDPGFDQPDVPDDQEQEDAPHQVVDVKAAARDVVKRADPGSDQVGDSTHDRKGEQKSKRGQEQALPALVLKMKPVDLP